MCIDILIADFLYWNMQTLKPGDISFRKRLVADQYPQHFITFSLGIFYRNIGRLYCVEQFIQKKVHFPVFSLKLLGNWNGARTPSYAFANILKSTEKQRRREEKGK